MALEEMYERYYECRAAALTEVK
jgi:hypothetical protein